MFYIGVNIYQTVDPESLRNKFGNPPQKYYTLQWWRERLLYKSEGQILLYLCELFHSVWSFLLKFWDESFLHVYQIYSVCIWCSHIVIVFKSCICQTPICLYKHGLLIAQIAQLLLFSLLKLLQLNFGSFRMFSLTILKWNHGVINDCLTSWGSSWGPHKTIHLLRDRDVLEACA